MIIRLLKEMIDYIKEKLSACEYITLKSGEIQ